MAIASEFYIAHLNISVEFDLNLNPEKRSLLQQWPRIPCRKEFAWLRIAALMLVLAGFIVSAPVDSCRAQDITFARPATTSAITINGQQINRWQAGKFEVLHVQGNAEVRQQDLLASANEAIIWVELPSDDAADFYAAPARAKNYRIVVFMQNNVVVELDSHNGVNPNGGRRDRITDRQWLGQLVTQATVDLTTATHPLATGQPPPIYYQALQNAVAAGITDVDPNRQSAAAQAPQNGNPAGSQTKNSNGPNARLVSAQTGQLSVAQPPPSLPSINEVPDLGSPQFELPTLDNQPLSDFGTTQPGDGSQPQPRPGFESGAISAGPDNARSDAKLAITARDSKVDLNFKTFNSPNRPDERISLGVGGVRIAIDSSKVSGSRLFTGDKDKMLVILADNVVQWQRTLADGTTNNELYLEGNVVFAKDRRTIYAERMYYNVERSQGTILKAEVLTPVPEYRGLVRLKADVVKQVDENRLQAFGTAFTSSRLGVPRYWLQSSQMNLTRQPTQAEDPNTGLPLFDPATGQPVIGEDYLAESVANRVYIAQVPVFAWPRFSTNLSDPSLYLTEFGVNNDNIFGTQIHTGFDLYKVLGITPPQGTRWTGVLDYLSERGVGYGSKFDYRRNGLFGIPGIAQGNYKSWFINDDGLDFLGRGRFNLVPEETFRGRIVGKHRHTIAPGFNVRAELGFVTDRNFLEQFYEREWDTSKDATTGLWIERNFDTQSYNLIADVQVNDFFTQTSWLKADHFRLGQPIFGDRAFFNSHSHIGYGDLQVASTPTDPTDAAFFDPLAWETDASGIRVGSRQELNVPLQLGPTKVVPYALTDFTFWQEALDNNDLFRAAGQVGVRASLPVWRVDPSVQSELLNVNGLAHKVTFDVDAFYADASQNVEELPLFDALDDDSQEHFRRRFAFSTFGIAPGGDTPLEFDERFFALRSALQGNVTSPSAEIFDDLSLVKLGVRQRWQTKRGAPGHERIIDLISFDLEGTIFPDADRDNFGSSVGLVNYDFRYHIGDRVSLLSDGYFDFFDEGLKTVSFGVRAQRPEVGDIYLGVRSIEGPISSNIITGTGTYRLSDKWGLKGGLQVDFGEVGTIGQRVGVVYIGESFLLEMAVNYDANRDNLGVRFNFEPRFLPQPRLFRPGGVAIPPAGSRYLE